MPDTKPIYALMLSYIPYTCYDKEAKIEDIYEDKEVADKKAYNYNLYAEKRREREIRQREFQMRNPDDATLTNWITDNPITEGEFMFAERAYVEEMSLILKNNNQ